MASTTEFAAEVRDAFADPAVLAERVEEEAERLKRDVDRGIFNNSQSIVGLEYEFYGVDEETKALRRVPRELLRLIGFEKEIGLHNAEMNTSPQPLNGYGLTTQRTEVQARLEAALARTRAEGITLVSDGLWTIPPTGESTIDYLTDTVEHDGITLTTNMSGDVRYHAMSNSPYEPRMAIDAPHVSCSAETVLLEALITSIQPHYQVSHAPDLPASFRYALRAAGPLLALGVNAPFFPPELYDDGVDPEAVLEDGWAEQRIDVFETVLNPADWRRGDRERDGKVRFPRDLETVAEAIDRLVADEPIVPQTVDGCGRFDDRYAHLEYKHGSYWRWVRPVFDAPSESAANARIEFRPLPAQPTIRDSVAFLAAFAGLMESLPRREHPVAALPWEDARENFYAAARDGLAADLTWITADGTETTNLEELYDDLFAAARDGLELRAISPAEVDDHLRLLEARVDRGVTPASWKRQVVRRRLEAGDSLAEAITGMGRSYVDHQSETLIDGTFLEWLE
ncbi:hypothetical protein [Natronobeatus ordinarius]|uniref:hypothetical protein n=1 Tax=Natronobeatus ordinarius TaxID=2963433 RepID=UPI0020CB9B24|nr:hypothetical protein [Natronobeatus ordinarius]